MKKTILITLTSLTLGCGLISTCRNKGVAEDEARDYAGELGLELRRVSCRSKDTDGDGYVSCTFVLESGLKEEYECASSFNLNTGCRKKEQLKFR